MKLLIFVILSLSFSKQIPEYLAISVDDVPQINSKVLYYSMRHLTHLRSEFDDMDIF